MWRLCPAPCLRQVSSRTLIARRWRSTLSFGQPLHETHPHLLKAGELTPGISALEYHARRSRLAAALPRNGIAVLSASSIKYRSGAAFYEFHQDPDFSYLTGFHEPDALAVIEKTTDDYRFHLYARPKDSRAEAWEGARSGLEAAKDVFNADEAYSTFDVQRSLPDLLQAADTVYTDISETSSKTSSRTLRELLPSVSATRIRPLRPFLNALRVVKSDAEVALMRYAGQASGRMLTEAMRQQWASETELWAYLEYGFRATKGLEGSAYLPVVAGGQNGLSIHNVRNDQVLNEHDLVLVDAGAQAGGYVADISRTWPVSGTFSPAQRDLYTVVLEAQRRCVSFCRQNAHMSLDTLHAVAETCLKDGLRSLGFDVAGRAMETLFPHHVGHHVGLDVHDAPGYPRTDIVKAGHCITIEPGVYVPDDDRWPSHFRGMAIRIEDSICVTEEHPHVLTTEAVKEIVDIEALRR